MKVGDYWVPTRAAGGRIAELGLTVERRTAPYAHMYYETDLPDEFVIISKGSPACAISVGVEGEPAVQVIRIAERIAKERKRLRPGAGSPDGCIYHDEVAAVDALKEAGCTRPVYKGETMPWWHHEYFTAARAAAFRAVR